MAASSSSAAGARQELRKLHEHVLNNKAEATSTNSNFLSKALSKANALYETTQKDARGAALDATVLSTTSMLGAEQAGNLEKITPEKYISKLRAVYGWSKASNAKIKWTELATAVADASIFEPAPGVTFIDGHFEAPAKKARQQRDKRSRDEPDGPAQVAATVDVQKLKETAEEKAQVVRMTLLQQTIKKHAVEAEAAGGQKRVSLFRALLHPTSFSQTVENFFDVSFLIKQGTVGISSDAHGVYVRPTKKPNTDEYNNKGLAWKQNVLKLDYQTWKKLVARHITPETPALLPGRAAGAPPPQAEAEDAADDEEDEQVGAASSSNAGKKARSK